MTSCISCETVSGAFQPPGGIIYENEYWIIALRKEPLRSPCYAFIILKRHCEHVHQLTADEAVSMGETMRLVAQVMDTVLQPAKIHFGLYAEEVKHLHIHAFPRMPEMIPGNKPNRQILRFYGLLNRWGLKQPFSDAEVATVAQQLRTGFEQVAQLQGEV